MNLSRKAVYFAVNPRGMLVLGINPSNAELNPNCRMLALLGAHHILHVSRIRVKLIGN
jgi:hypothetical protein